MDPGPGGFEFIPFRLKSQTHQLPHANEAGHAVAMLALTTAGRAEQLPRSNSTPQKLVFAVNNSKSAIQLNLSER